MENVVVGMLELTRIIGSLSKGLEFNGLHDGGCEGAGEMSALRLYFFCGLQPRVSGEDLQDTQAQKRCQTEFDAKFHLQSPKYAGRKERKGEISE
jgi:hypothetical protein